MGEKIDAQWYAENYTPWIDDINSYEDLEKFWANLNPRYKQRFDYWFKDIELKGKIFELGFNNGKTLKWLNDSYNNIRLYGFDFNEALTFIMPYLYKIKKVDSNGLQIANIIDGKGGIVGDIFDYITCLDFIEHLYHDDYLETIVIIKRILNPKGRVYVFAGYAKLKEHVNVLSIEEIRNDFTKAGFRFITKITEPGTGDTMQIFEK